ncbi:MAG: DUF885 domain-containing protein [Hyphomonadaceae bacterium]|nr:DUF885 domain-containing protein [Hyphomonadaceae bacterium]
MLRNLMAAIALATLAMAAGCATSEPAAEIVAPAPQTWAQFEARFIDGYFRANPPFAANQGKHEFDGRLPDWSEAGLDSAENFLKTSIAEAQAFDAASLSSEEKFARDYLVAVARGELFWSEVADQPHANPAFYSDSLSPSLYTTRPYAPADVRLRAYIAYLNAIPTAAAQIRANLRAPLALPLLEYGKVTFAGFADYYRGDGKAAFASVADPALQGQLATSTEAAATAMQGLADWLEGQRATATGSFALGADRFAQMLRDTEMVDTPLAELERIGREDLARNQQALREACARYAPRRSIARCMDRMNADKPEGGPVAGARAQLAGLKAFIQQHDLVSIPGTEEALVEESPAFARQNSAYIDIPGPYETNMPSVYYISPPDPSWSRAVQAAFIPGEPDLLFTSVHEVWPGHFLNFLHANRSQFTFGKVFVGYAFAEGWAHYTEEMMYEAGLGEGRPEVHIGQLSNALLRDCRFISAIGMHSGTMTQEQSFQMFKRECFQDEGNARQQAARGTYDPAYLNYTMGKLLIRRLREDWTATRGGRTAWKAFHDQFLSYGGPPIPLVRAQMMGGAPEAKF